MPRISRHQMFMEIAHVAAKRSTCFRANNGAVLVKDRNVISIGYNGPAAGEDHCYGTKCLNPDHQGCHRSIHAEENAIRRATTDQVIGATLYCTMSPCATTCAPLIIRGQLAAVFYEQPYRDTSGLQLLMGYRIGVYRLTPNGDVIDQRTGELVEVSDTL